MNTVGRTDRKATIERFGKSIENFEKELLDKLKNIYA